MAKQIEEFCAVGRRKEASARVRIRPGTGKVQVNGRDLNDYLPTDMLRQYVFQPLKIAGAEGKYDILVNADGGGQVGQTLAIRHGVTRALLKALPEQRGVLKAAGLITRDARVKERKKYGQPGARARFQFSKR